MEKNKNSVTVLNSAMGRLAIPSVFLLVLLTVDKIDSFPDNIMSNIARFFESAAAQGRAYAG